MGGGRIKGDELINRYDSIKNCEKNGLYICVEIKISKIKGVHICLKINLGEILSFKKFILKKVLKLYKMPYSPSQKYVSKNASV